MSDVGDANTDVVFAGTTIAVKVLVQYLQTGQTVADFLRDHPAVSQTQANALIGCMTDLRSAPSGGHVEKKDAWDKLGVLSTLIASVIIGGAGAWATHDYNEKQLLIANVKQLEEVFPYLSADDPQKRQFGYNMFGALGFPDLALALAKIKNNDSAAGQLAHSSLSSSDTHVASYALDIATASFEQWIWPNSVVATNGSPVDSRGQPAVVNRANVAALKSWMNAHGLSGVPIAKFLTSPLLSSERRQAILDLKIP